VSSHCYPIADFKFPSRHLRADLRYGARSFVRGNLGQFCPREVSRCRNIVCVAIRRRAEFDEHIATGRRWDWDLTDLIRRFELRIRPIKGRITATIRAAFMVWGRHIVVDSQDTEDGIQMAGLIR
jgi:hypothetical protein